MQINILLLLSVGEQRIDLMVSMMRSLRLSTLRGVQGKYSDLKWDTPLVKV